MGKQESFILAYIQRIPPLASLPCKALLFVIGIREQEEVAQDTQVQPQRIAKEQNCTASWVLTWSVAKEAPILIAQHNQYNIPTCQIHCGWLSLKSMCVHISMELMEAVLSAWRYTIRIYIHTHTYLYIHIQHMYSQYIDRYTYIYIYHV